MYIERLGDEDMEIGSFFAGLFTGVVLLISVVLIFVISTIGVSLGLAKNEVIQLIGFTSTIVVSFVSIWIALRSLKVSKESLLQSNRPYVVIYISSINSFKTEKYVIIKNFGKSGANIKKIKLNFQEDYFKDKRKLIEEFFLQHSKAFIAPNQSIQLPIFNFDLVGSIQITYVDSSGHIYEETYELDSKNIVYNTRYTSSKIEDDFHNKLLNLLHNSNRSSL